MVGNERGETETVQMELKSLSTLSLEKDVFLCCGQGGDYNQGVQVGKGETGLWRW